jgi:hypothetical protein
MTYQEALKDAQEAFYAGVHPAHIILALISEGIPRQRADTILRWCALNAEKYKQRLDIHT